MGFPTIRYVRPAKPQSLCLSLEYSMGVKLLTEHLLEVVNLKGGCTGSFECTLVKMSHCWESHVTAQLVMATHGASIDDFDQTAQIRRLI